MLSGILLFNQKGENLIFRAFRPDCRPRLADIFRIQVISNAQVRSPILTLGSTTFSHVKHENIYIVAVTKSNANAAVVFEFVYRFIALGKQYFGKFDEEAVKNNFVLIYELLDGRDTRLLLRNCLMALQKSSTLVTLKIPTSMSSSYTSLPTTSHPLFDRSPLLRPILPRSQCKRPALSHGEEET
jgi:hypothetical protein